MTRVRKPNRKRTSRKVPAKGRLRDMADQLWSLAVKNDWAGKCAVCGKRKCEAHHLIPRQHQATRYALRNGIALCAHCHQFDRDISPHQNAAGWVLWLHAHHKPLYEWYLETAATRNQTTGLITNADYYIEHIRRLSLYVEPEDYERIVGVRFASYLESSEEDDQ